MFLSDHDFPSNQSSQLTNKSPLDLIGFFSFNFLVACDATLHPAMLIGRSVGQLVGWSVGWLVREQCSSPEGDKVLKNTGGLLFVLPKEMKLYSTFVRVP